MPFRGNSVLPHRPPAQHKPDGPSPTQTKPHVAPQRQSAGEVARAHGVKKAAILDANPRLRHIPFLAQGDRIEIPQDRESKSKQYEVKQGDTPKSVAERHGVSEQVLRDENGLESFDRIEPGEVLNIPDAEEQPTRGSSRDTHDAHTVRTSWRPDAEPTTDPVTSAQQRTDEAAARAAEAELPPPGVMSGLSPSVQRVMIAESNAAQQELDAAVEAEITARANAPGQPPLTYDTLYNTAALAVESRVRGTATEEVVGAAVDRVQAVRAEGRAEQDAALAEIGRVNQALNAANAEADPAVALQSVNELLATLPPDKQEAVLADPRVTAIVEEASDKANEPLETYISQVEDGFPVGDRSTMDARFGQSTQAMVDMTEGLDPRLTTMLVDKQTQNVENALGRLDIDPEQREYLSADLATTSQNLTILAGRTFGAPDSVTTVDKVINIFGADNWSLAASMNAIGERGAPPALALRVGELRGESEEINVMVMGQIEAYAKNVVGGKFDEYVKVTEELAWLIANAGPAMSQDELEAAIAEYIADHPGYEEAVAEAEAKLAADGEKLVDQLVQVQTMTGNDYVGENMAEIVESISQQPGAMAAINAALQSNPALLTGERGLRTIDMFAAFRDIWNAEGGTFIEGFVEDLAGRYITNSLEQRLATLKPHDLRTAAALQKELANLSDSRLANALGLDKAALDGYLNDLGGIVDSLGPDRTKFPSQIRDELRDFRSALRRADLSPGAVAALSHVGQVLGVAGFLNSASEFADEPTLINGVETILEGTDALSAFPIGGKIGELLRSPGAGAFIGGAQALVGLVNAGIEVKNGDLVGGGITAVGAVGTGLIAAPAIASVFGATLAGSAYFGPIGFALVTMSVLGHAQWERIQESNKHMNETTAKFLGHSFDPEAARILYDQSANGFSTVPLIMAYGDSKGWSREETVQRINKMTPEQLVAFRNVLNHTLDEVGGDISKITETGPSDSDWTNREDSDIKLETLDSYDLTAVRDIKYDWGPVTIDPPTSYAEIEALLEFVTRNY
jgi:hypothetical protein